MNRLSFHTFEIAVHGIFYYAAAILCILCLSTSLIIWPDDWISSAYLLVRSGALAGAAAFFARRYDKLKDSWIDDVVTVKESEREAEATKEEVLVRRYRKTRVPRKRAINPIMRKSRKDEKIKS